VACEVAMQVAVYSIITSSSLLQGAHGDLRKYLNVNELYIGVFETTLLIKISFAPSTPSCSSSAPMLGLTKVFILIKASGVPDTRATGAMTLVLALNYSGQIIIFSIAKHN